MSVFVIIRVPGDPAGFEQYASGSGDLLKRVEHASQEAGAIHHAFAAGDGEIVVIDEWPDEGSFQKFFSSQPDIPQLMQEGGAKGAPQVSVYRRLDTPDAF